jgi:hypothetical protein
MKNDYDFKSAESCMYHHLENLARIEALRDELRIVDAMSSVKIQNYEFQPGAPDGYIDNIPIRIMKIDALESLILGLERWTKPMTRLIADLESPYSSPERQEMLGILRFRYLGGNTWTRTEGLLEMSHATFLERRKELVRMAMGYIVFNTAKNLNPT